MSTWANLENSEIPNLLKALKNLLKAKGLLYQDVARVLSVSETTVKRYLTGHGLTVGVLEELCAIVGVRLSDLLDIARAPDRTLPSLSADDERALAMDPLMAALFYLLSQGYSASTLQRDFAMSDAEMNGYLTKLDKLDLIQLLPYNRVRMRIQRNFTVTRGGPLMKLARDTLVLDLFERFDFSEGDWILSYAKFSEASLQRIRELQQDFLRAIFAIAARDKEISTELAKWKGLFFTMRPVDIPALKDWPKQRRKPKPTS